MDTTKLGPVYLFGIALNLTAMAYAFWQGAYLWAATFVFVMAYLAFRYRTLGEFSSSD